jgi:large subunit ribosomal protein L33
MAASRRKKIMMLSEGKLQNGKPTKTVYYSTIGEGKEKLKLRKFDPRAYNTETGKMGMHVLFNEKKVPK